MKIDSLKKLDYIVKYPQVVTPVALKQKALNKREQKLHLQDKHTIRING